VTLVQRPARLLPKEDPEAGEAVRSALAADGVEVLTGHEALRVERDEQGQRLIVRGPEGERALPFDRLLLALGRTPNTAGLGLEDLGIRISPKGTIEHDARMRTAVPNILVCGDVAGPFQLTHAAAHQAWYAAVNGLVAPFWSFRADYRVLPWCTYTDPEVARVGLSEEEARRLGVAHEITRYGIDDLDRAIADGHAEGYVKVLTEPGRDRILGVTIVGAHAGDLIAEFVLAMRHGLGLRKILGPCTATRRWPKPTSTPPAPGPARTPRPQPCAGWSASIAGGGGEGGGQDRGWHARSLDVGARSARDPDSRHIESRPRALLRHKRDRARGGGSPSAAMTRRCPATEQDSAPRARHARRR
jgi:hypothetical protein